MPSCLCPLQGSRFPAASGEATPWVAICTEFHKPKEAGAPGPVQALEILTPRAVALGNSCFLPQAVSPKGDSASMQGRKAGESR